MSTVEKACMGAIPLLAFTALLASIELLRSPVVRRAFDEAFGSWMAYPSLMFALFALCAFGACTTLLRAK